MTDKDRPLGQRPFDGPPDELLRPLMDKMVDYTWTMGLDMRFTYVSPAVERVTGFTPEEMMAKTLDELMVPEDLEEALGRVTVALEALDKGEVVDPIDSMEMRLKRKDGATIITEVFATFIKDEKGEPVGMVGLTRDITERKRANESRRESEEMLHAVCSSIHDAIIMTDDRSRVMMWNPAAEAMFGYTASEAEGRPLSDLIVTQDQRTAYRAGLDEFRRRGTTSMAAHPIEVDAMRKNGSTFPVEMTISTFGMGGRQYSVGVVRGIAYRRKAQEQLMESEAKYRTLFERSPEGIVILDLNGTVVDCNPAILAILSMPRERLVGKGFKEIIPMDESYEEEFTRTFMSLLDGIPPSPTEVRFSIPGGMDVWVEAVPTLFKRGDEITGIQVIVRDITARKDKETRAEERLAVLERQKQELELLLRPQYENGNGDEIKRRLEEGSSYLALDEVPDKAVGVFVDHVRHGHQGLVITRQRPDVLRQRLDLQRTPFIWLTSRVKEGEVCIDPTAIGDLSTAVMTFLAKTEKGIVLFTGVEYLVSHNGFKQVVNLIYHINDKVMVADDILIVALNPEALSKQEVNIISSEFLILEEDDAGRGTRGTARRAS